MDSKIIGVWVVESVGEVELTEESVGHDFGTIVALIPWKHRESLGKRMNKGWERIVWIVKKNEFNVFDS